MAKITAPDNIQIASMQEKKVLAASDAMTPGKGTSWEDRGAQGLLSGFVKSAFGMMFKPVQLLWQIRRPETTRETAWFVAGCGFFWAIGITLQSTLQYFTTYRQFATYSPENALRVDTAVYFLIPAWWRWR